MYFSKDIFKKHLLICKGKTSEVIHNDCDKVFKTKGHLQRHVSQIHGVKEIQRTYPLCNKKYDSMELSEHMEPLINLGIVMCLELPTSLTDDVFDEDNDITPSMVLEYSLSGKCVSYDIFYQKKLQ